MVEIATFDLFEISEVIDGAKEYNWEVLDYQLWCWEARDDGFG